jgi:hypothetical protein
MRHRAASADQVDAAQATLVEPRERTPAATGHKKLIAAFDALVLKTEGTRRKKHFKSPVLFARNPDTG